MTSYLRNSILATIVYYDIFDYPLTLLEVYKFLINPGRVVRVTGGLGEIDLGDVLKEIRDLVKSGILGQKNGFYFLSSHDNLYGLRINNQKITDQKWKKFLKVVKFLALAPYLRGVFASGSMALGNTTEESDFDVLIIAKPGRLYTCRLFLWLISSLLGVRRKKNEKIAPDKLCFNHYITEDNLALVHRSLFNAQTYINLKPAMIKPELIDKFYISNLWLNDYAYNFKVQKDFTRRNINTPRFFKFLAKIGEFILDVSLGDWFEELSKHRQQKLIRNNPITYRSGGRITFNNKELEFHPHSFEKVVVEEYGKGIRRVGVVPYVEERDSGLSR